MFVHPQATESEMGDVDLSGLPEAPVDSEDEEEDEDIERSSEALLARDLVRECLEKDAVDRSDDDIGKAMILSPGLSVCRDEHGFCAHKTPFWLLMYFIFRVLGLLMFIVVNMCLSRVLQSSCWSSCISCQRLLT